MIVYFDRPVQTRDGKPVRILCTDKKNTIYPVVGLINRGSYEEVGAWTREGNWSYFEKEREPEDLIQAPIISPEDFPWSCIRDKFQWAAMDSTEGWRIYTDKPVLGDITWTTMMENKRVDTYLKTPSVPCAYWRETLIQRPKGV